MANEVKMAERTSVDVVVIGAGISGLMAAYHILKKCPTLKVVVLEAKDRVGGRTLTQEMKTANGTDSWDLGGQWVGTSQQLVCELLKELGLETCRQYDVGRKYMQLGGDRISSYTSNLPSLPLLALLDLSRFINKIEGMRKCVSVSDPYSCPQAELWDSMTFDTFLQKSVWTEAARDSIRSATRTMFGVECCHLSLLYYLMYLSSGGGIERLVDTTEESAQGFTIKGGAQQISLELTKLIKAKNVLTGHPVVSVNQHHDGVDVKCTGGRRFHCARLVISTPPHQTARIHFHPALPLNKQELCRRMPVGLLTKVIISYPEAFWRKNGGCGEFVTNGGPIRAKGCRSGPVSLTYDATSSNGNPALVVFLGGSPAVEWSQVEERERQAAVLDTLSQVWGQVVYDYVDYWEKDWSGEPYSHGSPVNSVAPGGMRFFTALRQPFLRTHFAGSESATVYCGYMNGAVQAGIRAANEVLYNLKPDFVTEDDLEDTCYAPRSLQGTERDEKPSVIGRAVAVTFGLGIVASAVFFGHKYIHMLKK